jgi:inner membrane protein
LDSITQIALGAAVGEAVLGHKIGRKALLWGAALGTLPDLDIVVQSADPVLSFTGHRGFSHSLLVCLAVSPLFAWLLKRLHPLAKVEFRRWVLFTFLCLSTHILLDACTTYGTQLFWPFDSPPVAWSFIFIIDPLFTLPLLVGVVVASCFKRNRSLGRRFNNAALSISSAYLLVALIVKLVVVSTIDEQLLSRNVVAKQAMIVPMPFNIMLWRIIALNEKGYYEGYYSVFDKEEMVLRQYASDYHLANALQDHEPVQRLKWFTHNFYSIEQLGKDIVMSDIRLGSHGHYPFSFRVAKINDEELHPVDAEYMQMPSYDAEDLRWVFRRITDQTLDSQPAEVVTPNNQDSG